MSLRHRAVENSASPSITLNHASPASSVGANLRPLLRRPKLWSWMAWTISWASVSRSWSLSVSTLISSSSVTTQRVLSSNE